MLRIKKGFVFLFIAILGVALLIRYTLRDLNLNVDLLKRSLENMPSIVLENLEFEREISGDLWQVEVPRASRRDGVIEIDSIEIRRWLQDGREWYFRSDRGKYFEMQKTAELEKLLGTLETDARVLNLESPHLLWSNEKNEFVFSKGLTIYDDEFILKTPLASIDTTGVVLLDKGGSIKWTRRTR